MSPATRVGADGTARTAPVVSRPVGPSDRVTAAVLVVGGIAGLLAAFTLVLDRLALLENPAFVPSCDLNAVVSCGSIMSSPQSELFGFPNPLIGLVTFPVVTTIGVALAGGVHLPRWTWTGLLVGCAGGVALVGWLIVQSLFVIGALCPYCMIVWVATMSVAWYTLLHHRRTRPGRFGRATMIALAYHSTLLAAVIAGVALLVLVRFGPGLLAATT